VDSCPLITSDDPSSRAGFSSRTRKFLLGCHADDHGSIDIHVERNSFRFRKLDEMRRKRHHLGHLKILACDGKDHAVSARGRPSFDLHRDEIDGSVVGEQIEA